MVFMPVQDLVLYVAGEGDVDEFQCTDVSSFGLVVFATYPTLFLSERSSGYTFGNHED